MSFVRRPSLARRLGIGSAGLVLVGAIGCSQPASPVTPPVVAAAVQQPEPIPAPPPPATTATPTPPAPVATQPAPPPPPEFSFPSDTAGKGLPAVVVPQAPAPLPVERFGGAAVKRTPPARVVNPDPLPKLTHVPPPLPLAKPAGVKPVAPAEQVPYSLGLSTATLRPRPALPEAPGVTAKARDVAVPPDMAPFARPLPDRASLDDPTAELANTAIVASSPAVALAPAEFLKVVIPDPFELADQVRPKVAPAAEPGLTPVPVNPRRPK